MSETLKYSHYRDLAGQLELSPNCQFVYKFLSPSGPDQYGIYKCGLCGEAGTFIQTPTHWRPNPERTMNIPVHDLPLTRVMKAEPTSWCAGRPDLKRDD